MKESDIQKIVFDYLTSLTTPGLFVFSIPNEAFLMAAHVAGMEPKTISILSTHLKKMGLVPGVPDMCILFQGKTYFFEFKKPRQKPTKIQSIIHMKIRQAGHKIRVIESLEDAKIFLAIRGIE